MRYVVLDIGCYFRSPIVLNIDPCLPKPSRCRGLCAGRDTPVSALQTLDYRSQDSSRQAKKIENHSWPIVGRNNLLYVRETRATYRTRRYRIERGAPPTRKDLAAV